MMPRLALIVGLGLLALLAGCSTKVDEDGKIPSHLAGRKLEPPVLRGVGVSVGRGAQTGTVTSLVGPGVYLERVLPRGEAVAEQVAAHLASLGPAAAGGGIAAVPRSVVVWRLRDPRQRLRVVIPAEVCLREGFLEHLLTRTEAGKNHESILHGSFDARHIKFALLATGAEPGKPAQFVNDKQEVDFKPATGERILVTVEWVQPDGARISVPAQSWIVDTEGKPLESDWVFAGSQMHPNPDNPGEPFFGANEGRVICVSNFASALLDLPFESTESDASRQFRANTDVIPPIGTKVLVILEPIPK